MEERARVRDLLPEQANASHPDRSEFKPVVLRVYVSLCLRRDLGLCEYYVARAVTSGCAGF